MYTTSQRKSIGLGAVLLAFFLILILTLAPAQADTQAATKVQPALLTLAADQPDTAVRVMIQKSAPDVDVESLVTQSGGTVIHDLYIVNAVVAEMEAETAVSLAHNAAVAGISLDGQLFSSELTTYTLRDEFNNESYDNNNGTETWTSSWSETNDDGNPSYGNIEIYQGELILKDDNRSIQRSANLSDAETAVLSFDYRRYSFDESSDYVAIQISTDDGANWVEIDRFAGPANDSSMQAVNYDLAEYIPNNIIIRFATSSSLSRYDRLYIDNVQIEYGTTSPPSDTTGTPQIFRDEFNLVAYDNNDGQDAWLGSWVENDPNGNEAAGGNVLVDNGRLTFNLSTEDSQNITRQADLSSASQAILSFDWQTSNLDNGQTVSIQISQDGAYSFETLDTFTGSQSGTAQYDISSYLSGNTTIRFEGVGQKALLEIEAEDAQLSGNFQVGYDPIASGGRYIGTPSNAEYLDSIQSTNWAEFVFFVTEAGAYTIEGDVYAPHGADDSFWVTVDGMPSNGYLWDALINTSYATDPVSNRTPLEDPVVVNLTAGQHVVRIYQREDGARLDVLRLKNVNSSTSNDLFAFFDNVQIETTATTPDENPTPPPPESTEVSQIFRDEFNLVAYDNNDGQDTWQGGWVENDPYGGMGALGGYVYVENGRFTFHYTYVNAESAFRSADLSGAAQARLTFDWQTVNLGEGETISVLVSQDGQQFTELAAYGGSQSGTATLDISEYIGSATTIRFENRSSNWEIGEFAYFDNVQIETTDTSSTLNHYLNTSNVQPVWDMGLQGQGVAVAIIDSGISPNLDFGDRLVAQVSFNAEAQTANDRYGHGTHVASIIGGDGTNSSGLYKGVAPQVNLIGLKVSDETGMAYESDTVAAMQWVLENKDVYNIRVVNISLNSTLEESYHTSALDLASELLWFNGVVVVASAGNRSLDGNFYTITASPANDPFIITVGASTESGTDDIKDDDIALFSAHGETVDGFTKPDIIAPGYNIISLLSDDSDWSVTHEDRLEYFGDYFRLSGTSMAAPIVSGAAAILLQAEPDLTPDQVKYRLMNASNTITPLWFDAILDPTVYPYLDMNTAVTTPTYESANQDTMPHMALAQMALIAYWASENGGDDIDWSNIDWESVNWDNVDWDAVDWDSVNWGSVNWGSVNWGSVNWGSVNWGSVNWGSVNWGSVNWGSVNWGSVNWGSVNWGSVNWGSVIWDN